MMLYTVALRDCGSGNNNEEMVCACLCVRAREMCMEKASLPDRA